MEKAKQRLDLGLRSFCIVLFSFLVLLVSWQVITRFVFNAPSSFSEEFAQYCFVWLALFGGALVFGEKGHIAVTFVKERFPAQFRYVINWLIELMTSAFAVLVMIIGGIQLMLLTWSQTSASLGVPVGLLYSAIPISGIFIVIYCAFHMHALAKTAPKQK